MPLHQRCDLTVLRATNQIALPMTRNGAVLDFCGPLPDGDGIYDLTARVFKDTRVLRPAYAAPNLPGCIACSIKITSRVSAFSDAALFPV
jgi:hypothetical protein